jgi:hypothetical protein
VYKILISKINEIFYVLIVINKNSTEYLLFYFVIYNLYLLELKLRNNKNKILF